MIRLINMCMSSELRKWIALVESGGYNLPRDMRAWVTGRCFDFAVAFSERMPKAEFVGVGTKRHLDHVALRQDGKYYDARGEMDENEFLTLTRADNPFAVEDIIPISRDTVELHCGCAGMTPPYRGNQDIAEARRAVSAIYGKRRNEVP